MLSLSRRSVLLLVVALAAAAAGAEQVDEARFHELINSQSTQAAFAKFYAPWCGHCKKLAPAWSSMAAAVGGRARVLEVDCTAEKELCADQAVRGYPTLLYYAPGSVQGEPYKQRARDAPALFRYVASRAAFELSDAERLEYGSPEEILRLVAAGEVSTYEVVRNLLITGGVLLALAYVFCGGFGRTSQVLSSQVQTEVVQVIRDAVRAHSVVVFSKTTCPYCAEAKKLLPSDAHVIELDEREDGPAIQAALEHLTGQRTVPNVFIHGRSIGGCDDTKRHYKSGRLRKMIETGR